MTHEYDYVIVGAGSAGCVLAERLTANGRHQVLLIEAGGHDVRPWIKIPLGYGLTFADPKVNWKYQSEPDPGLNGRTEYWPRGKVIGGSSSINAMAYMRGLPHDFDDWAAAGAEGWDWLTVQGYYDALECHNERDTSGKPVKRGSGPIHVSDLSHQMHPFSKHFLSAAQDMGWPILGDLNVANTQSAGQTMGEGLGYMRSTVRGGLRWSAADAFLKTARRRPTLTIVSNALVERLLFRGQRAVGVRLRQNGRLLKAIAHREVLISAGAINSPQLLQLSGIGPAAMLRSHGLRVHQDVSQVGQGLQDHLALTQAFEATAETLNAKLGSRFGQFRAGVQYLTTRSGPLSVPVNQCSGFVRSEGALLPDIQLYCNPIAYKTVPSGQPQVHRTNGFVLCVQPGRPTSRGSVNLRSGDPNQPPEIRTNALSTEQDRITAVRAGRLLQNLASTPTIQSVTKRLIGSDLLAMDDDMLLETFRERASTVFHPTCTCRMGQDATDSVLDARLRVHGVPGLRVIDASAFPNITSGNTNAPTMMLAARAADLVLEDAEQHALAAE